MGQHLDDLAESFLMYAFQNGRLETMKANSPLDGDEELSIIRPFVFVREVMTKSYSKLFQLPIISENCPACFAAPKERARMKSLLAAQENLFPNLFGKLKAALTPIMHNDVDPKAVYDALQDKSNSEEIDERDSDSSEVSSESAKLSSVPADQIADQDFYRVGAITISTGYSSLRGPCAGDKDYSQLDGAEKKTRRRARTNSIPTRPSQLGMENLFSAESPAVL